jgi:hypothetical protein
MLEIGNGGQNKTEYTTQFSLWCIAKAVRKRHFCPFIYIYMRSFCQDRLGTNIGKTQKWTVFLQVLLLGCDLSAPMVRNGTAADAFEIILNKEAIAVSQVLMYCL